MNRKDEHLKLALKQTESINDFDKIKFVHNALHDIKYNEIKIDTCFAGNSFEYPIYINAMTGGTETSKSVNEKLAMLAHKFNIPIATGSLAILIKDPSQVDSFKIIREKNPNGIIIANIGADKGFNDVQKLIKVIDANILQIHLNIVQEMIMPEGERDFSNLANNIKEIITNIDIPVIVKEVGFGMSESSIRILKELGINTVDVSGSGGTNFAKIENTRGRNRLSYLNNYGLSTVESLLEATKVSNLEILASGGVRNPLDVIKSLALGGKAVGMSKYFLNLVTNNSMNEAYSIFNQFLDDLKTIMTIIGVRNIKELRKTELIFNPELYNFLEQRSINKNIIYCR